MSNAKQNNVKKVYIIGVIAGIVVGAIVSLWCLTKNWDNYAEFSFKFPSGKPTTETGYMSISKKGGQKDIAVYQSAGTKSTSYCFYYQKRGSWGWTYIKTETFKKNGESNTHCIGKYNGASFRDVKLKAKKINNASNYSKLVGYMGVCY